ncbi:MAG: 1,4-alpha-glucan branching protein GlgB [Ruminococcus sp.]|nr:1,4-alpha-glucan branching protein GlgB [Ruminococcus sp.]
MIDSIDSYLKGLSFDAYETMGAHLRGGSAQFVTYAPNAVNVELMLNGSLYDMHRDGRGVWSCTRDGVRQGDIYQYVITTKTLEKHYRSDPFAFYSEVRPKNASIIYDIDSYSWSDDAWLSSRDKNYEKPMNIYEMHFGSWRIKEGRTQTERFYTYAEMADILIPYIKEMGYTHIEILPLTEHPFDGSWGYQATGYYSATSRYGDPNGLKSFIDKCHGAGIGVILDFVPVHFARDFFGLHIYDGGFVFESDNENERYSEWNTALFDYSKPHVVSFMKSAVNFWIEKYHIDGIRFDAVANLIFRRGRKDMPINDSGLWFIRDTNYTMQRLHPDVMLFAEDSTDYGKVTAPVEFGGLGFDYKWDLGFMNDTINYIKTPPNERSKHHNKMTFSMSYFYSDLFILPYSHDEVVHGKGTMLDKAQGDHEQKMATIRAFYMWQMTHPGKKLNFMGNELGEYMEWREEKELGWNLLTYPSHDSLHEYIKKLDQLYLTEPALYKYDYNAASFRWVDVNNSGRSIFAFQRNDLAGHLIYCVFNFSASRQSYTLNVNANGEYEEMLNSDRDIYSGSNCLNEHCFANGYKLNIKLAPLSAVMLRKK